MSQEGIHPKGRSAFWELKKQMSTTWCGSEKPKKKNTLWLYSFPPATYHFYCYNCSYSSSFLYADGFLSLLSPEEHCPPATLLQEHGCSTARGAAPSSGQCHGSSRAAPRGAGCTIPPRSAAQCSCLTDITAAFCPSRLPVLHPVLLNSSSNALHFHTSLRIPACCLS